MTSHPIPERLALFRWPTTGRLWFVSIVTTIWLVLLSGLIGALQSGVPLMDGIRAAATSSHALLLAALSAWLIGCFAAQHQWDRLYRAERWRVAGNPSVSAVATIAAFSTVGVVAAAVALPVFVTATSSVKLLAIGIAAVVVPTATPLLMLKYAELLAVDRYRVGLRVAPAGWHFAWTWPFVLIGWHLVTPLADLVVPLPPRVAAVWPYGATMHVSIWDAVFFAIAMPTFVAFVYSVRRTIEYFIRLFIP